MKWIEYMILGAIGGLAAFIGLSIIGAEEELSDILLISLLQYANNIEVMLLAIFLGALGGRFSKSALGAIIGGAAAPLIIEMLPAVLESLPIAL